VLSLSSDNQLRMDVPPEFASLRNSMQTLSTPQGSATIKNRAGEIVCSFKAGQGACGLQLLAGAVQLFAIHVDGSKPSATVGGKMVALTPDHDGVSTVRLWIDGSIIETLVDSREAVTTRCYTPSPDGIKIKCTGAPGVVQSLTVSGVTPISGDRLTS
jgi:Glycosyl hydrolases family 32 C terminal